jgi:hypothetical protein
MGTDSRTLRQELGCVAWVLGITGVALCLHYAPVLLEKMLGRELIEERLGTIYRGNPQVEIIKSSDYSNYSGLFNLSGLAPIGGNEERWDFCLLVGATSANGSTNVEAFSAGGDRALKTMVLRKVPDFDKCRSDQRG